MELVWNSLDNAPSSIVFYLEMKVEAEVGVHDIRSRFTPRLLPSLQVRHFYSGQSNGLKNLKLCRLYTI